MDEKQPTSFPLRLSPSLRASAIGFAKQESISLNHFISLAIAEKVSRLEQADWLKRREKELAATKSPVGTNPNLMLRRFQTGSRPH